LRVHGLDFRSGRSALPLPAQLARICADGDIDLVHAHGVRSAAPAAVLPRARRPAFVYTVHGFHHRRKPWLRRGVGHCVEQVCMARADHVVFVSAADLAHAREAGLLAPGHGGLIRNGVSVPDALARPAAARDVDLAFVGRIHPQKDPLILPEILLALRPLRPSLLIVGGGPLEQALEARIEALGLGGQVLRSPALPRAEAMAQLARARVLVLPSLWEGLPLALAEAMLLGVAVVASAVTGNDEIVRDRHNGRLAPPRDAAAFAQAISELLTEPAEWRRLTERAACEVRDRFSVGAQVDAHHSLYLDLVAKRKRATWDVRAVQAAWPRQTPRTQRERVDRRLG
jgi:glycosyltransferase involved in cell wall biosynthesis